MQTAPQPVVIPTAGCWYGQVAIFSESELQQRVFWLLRSDDEVMNGTAGWAAGILVPAALLSASCRGDSPRAIEMSSSTELLSAIGAAMVDYHRFSVTLAAALPGADCADRLADASAMRIVCLPPPPPTSRVFSDLSSLAPRLRDLESSQDADSLLTRAVWTVLWAESSDTVDRALVDLDLARALEPDREDVSLATSAAYLIRAALTDAPRDLLRGLDEAERAASGEVGRAFKRNQYVALDQLGLAEVADCFERSGAPCDGQGNRAGERFQSLESASGEQLAHLVAQYPQQAREWAFDELLLVWGDAEISAKRTLAEDRLTRAALVAGHLSRRSGDRTVEIGVDAARASKGHKRRLLAEGHVALGRGRRSFDSLRIGEARRQLEVARARLGAGGSAGAAWAELWLAGCDVYEGNAAAARPKFETIAEGAGQAFALRARALWGAGLASGRSGDLVGAEKPLSEAVEIFDRIGESENLGAVLGIVEQVYEALGETDLAWRVRIRSLRKLAATQGSHWLGMTLSGAVQGARDLGTFRAAMKLSDLWLGTLDESREAALRVPAHLMRASVSARLGMDDEAVTELESARELVSMEQDETMKAQLTIDADLVAASILARRDPTAAEAAASRAMRGASSLTDRVLELKARLGRARARRVQGDFAGARGDLEQALEQASLRTDEGPKVSSHDSLEARQTLIDELIDLLLSRPEWRAEALDRLESELRPRHGTGERRYTDWESRMKELSGEQNSVVRFVVLPESLAVWVATGGTLCFDWAPLGRVELESRIDKVAATIRGARDVEWIGATKSFLVDLLGSCAAEWPREGRLAVVADRRLANLPFAALPDPTRGRPIVESLTVLRLKSLEDWRSAMQDAPTRGPSRERWSALAIGISSPSRFGRVELPALPEAELEATEVAALYPGSKRLLGSQAKRATILAEIRNHEVLHFAGHSIGVGEDPTQARLLVSGPEGASQQLDPRDLAVRAGPRLRLVVLSSCTSGLVDGRAAGATRSILGAFERTAAAAVLSTVWDVADAEARSLLRGFHENLAAGMDGASALRKAQLDALHQGQGASSLPRNWAAFQLWGQIPAATPGERRHDA